MYRSLVEKARVFATAAHAAVGQRRKYLDNVPYIQHPLAVAGLVRSVPHTAEMVAAALLHDVIEDTHVSLDVVRAEFGEYVGSLVFQLTDISRPEDGNRAKRKAIDLAYIAQALPEAMTVKLADIYENTSTIVEYDPAFAKVYLAEAAALLEVLRPGDPSLWERASAQLAEARKRLAFAEAA